MEKDDLSDLRIEKKEEKAGGPSHRMRPFVKTAIIGIAVLIILLISWAALRPAVSVSVTSVSQFYPSQAITVLNASGYVVAQRKASVAAKVTGKLIAITVEEGSRIKKGEVIARLESEDLKAQRAQAAANLSGARHNYRQAQAEWADARTNFERAATLVKSGYISRSDYDTAETRFAKARAALSASEAAVKSYEAALDAAVVNLEYTLIRAPFDGVVLTKNADIGDIVTPIGAAANAKSAVVTMADMDSLEVEVDVSESNLSKVRIDQPGEIQLDAVPDQRFAGSVHTIVPTADRNKASVMVKVRFLKKDPRVLPEMSAKVAFLSRALDAREEAPRLGISKNAITVRNGKPVTFILKGERAEEVPVKTGEAFGDMLEVLQGPKPGDRAIVNPPESMKSGDKVRVAEK